MKLLIALDNNTGARHIAEAGYKLAEALHAHTVLLHVTSNATYYASPNYSPILGYNNFNNAEAVQTDTGEKLKTAAEDYLDNVKWNLGDKTIETVVKEGDYAESILETAKEIKADMIVMGTHSRKGLDKVLLGSVAEKVLRSSTIPLFIIPVKTADEE